MLVSCMNLKKMEIYLRVSLLGPGPRLIKMNLLGRSLTKVEKHWYRTWCPLLTILKRSKVFTH